MAVGINLPDLPPLNLLQVNTGLQPDDGLGDTWYLAFAKHNANMEKLATFAAQVLNRLEEISHTAAGAITRIESLEQRVTILERLVQILTDRLDLNLQDILNRLAIIEKRLLSLPLSAYPERPVEMIGFGKSLPTGFTQVKALAFGLTTNPYTVKGLGFFTGGNPIRVLLYNEEWRNAGQDQRITTGGTMNWYIFFGHLVKAETVVGITFQNQYSNAAQQATIGTQTVVALGADGNPVALYSTTTTYDKGALVTDNADLYATGTKWYRSRVADNTNNALTSLSHWEEVPKQASRFKISATVTSAGGERFIKLGFPANAEIPENVDGTGRKALMPCQDRGLITVVAA